MKTTSFIQATFRLRVLFGIISLLILATIIGVIVREERNRNQWKRFQAQYNSQYVELLDGKIKEVEQAGDQEAMKKWAKLKDDQLRSQEIKMQQVFLPGTQTRDLCMTCHIGMKNSLFAEAANPLKAHPPEILKDHKIDGFGCTLCHHGQGVGLTVDKAHGKEHNWELPRLPMEYVQSSCFECHENVFGLKGAEKASEGRILFVEKGCYGCHDANVMEGLPKFSVPFSGLAGKIQSRNWVAKWVEDPQAIRPATLMPKFRIKPEQIRDISEYIYSLPDKDLQLKAYSAGQAKADTGRQLFTDKGCVACHSPERDKPGLTNRIPLLADAGLKMKSDWLSNWIENPKTVNPDTWMPKLELTADDILHLTAYVGTLKDATVADRLKEESPAGNGEEGKALVQSLGCLGCHKIKDKTDPAKVGVSVMDVADKRMEELPFGNSKVPHTKWDWLRNKISTPEVYQTDDMPMYMPNYVLSDTEIQRLTVFYLYNRLLKIPESFISRASAGDRMEERGDWMIRHFNCQGCHQILKDADKPRIDAHLDRKTMVPPMIVDEAEKVQPDWMFDYLRRPSAMRPWLQIRMPQFNFSYHEVTLLIEYMHAIMPDEKREQFAIPYDSQLVRSDYTDETIEMGKYRFRNDKCMQCHPVSFTGELPEGKSVEDMSLNLMLVKSRLRYHWIINFMRDPAQFVGTQTRMPYVFYTPDKVPRIPDPEAWLERTALFLMFMEEIPEPLAEEEKAREVQSFDFNNY
ncbi:MAG: c-type cytochrome [Thermodesulfobacteriota bacterium]